MQVRYFCQNKGKVVTIVVKNTVISPNFLVLKFCEKAQFPHSFGITVFFAVNLNVKSSVKLNNL